MLLKNQIKSPHYENPETEIDLSDKTITDSQLRMLFALCHPSLSREEQIGLSRRILCGFGIDEIAKRMEKQQPLLKQKSCN